MKIETMEEQSVVIIETDEDEQNMYYRWSADNWSVMYGCSLEELYNCEEIEALYQNHINRTTGEIK